MKLISFYYPSTEIKHSISIVLFFRLVGIYVAEIQTDIGILSENYKETTSLSDAVVYLSIDEKVQNENNYELSFCDKKFIELQKDIIYQSNNYRIIEFILKQLLEREIIDKKEYVDLMDALEVFDSESYVEATLLGKYYFEHSVNNNIGYIHEIYREMAGKLMKILKGHNVKLWGDDEYIHCRYAFVNIFFELNLFCKKNGIDYFMDLQSILNACKHIGEDAGQYLGNSFKLLQAQIYEQLLEKVSDAFQLYVLCCNNTYDSYVFFCKGNIMYKKRDLNRAIDYFKQSTQIYSQYYRAWFKLGVCYLESDVQKNGEMAINAFDKVIRILSNKTKNNLLRAMEVEYLFNSYMHILDIKKEFGDFRGALAACDEALKAYYNIEKSTFYEELNIDLMNITQIRKDIESHLDILRLKKEGIELSMMFDLTSNAIEYASLYN